jgi:hypothetical protein
MSERMYSEHEIPMPDGYVRVEVQLRSGERIIHDDWTQAMVGRAAMAGLSVLVLGPGSAPDNSEYENAAEGHS